MTRTPVKSSNVKSVGYDPATKAMEVEFHTGAVYTHSGVSANDHSALVNSSSIGSHYHKNFKGKFNPKAA
jgi:hypothetical protein